MSLVPQIGRGYEPALTDPDIAKAHEMALTAIIHIAGIRQTSLSANEV
jgi:hypothetical protein